MEKGTNKRLLVLFVISIFLLSCNSSRRFLYQFTDENKAVIRHVLSHGRVSCENCYFNGACAQIVDSTVSKNSYKLEGKCFLYRYIVTTESQKDGAEMGIKVKCATLLGRNKENENYFLDEIASALFVANQNYIKSQLKVDSSKLK